MVQKERDTVLYHQLFSYSTWAERAGMVVAVVSAALCGGCIMTWLMVQFGELNSLMVDRSVMVGTSTPTIILKFFGGGRVLTNASAEENREAMHEDCRAYSIGLVLQLVLGTALAGLAATIFNSVALRQVIRMRIKYLESVLRQDMAWFDTDTNLNVASTMSDDFIKIKEGLAEKVAMVVFLMGTAVMGVGVSFKYGWQLTLAAMTILPFSISSAVWVSNYQTKSGAEEQESYSHAGRIVEETLAGVRTVVAFGGEKTQIERYTKALMPAEKNGRRRGYIGGVGACVSWFLTYTLTAIVFIYGVRLILWDYEVPFEERTYFASSLMTILFSVFMASQNVSLCATHVETFAAARGAARSVFRMFERTPHIDGMHERGERPSLLVGEVKLDNVHFSYPARPDVKVLRGLSLHIKPGETVALVGSSGCGKSTILQLVQRLYDPESGTVYVGQNNVKNLNLSWLRTKIGVVGQEPVLFSGTIKENIALGKPDATFEEITQAAKLAHAHEFITGLSNGYETALGERGAQLSGGQKQRIAIARSIVREPPLLLLDEATSALDPHSERTVQAALDKASVGRTTLVVSHRLSTIVNASRIICMEQGVIVEQGTHSQLLKKKGFYWKLVGASSELGPPPVETVPEDGEDEVNEEGEALRQRQPKPRPPTAAVASPLRRNSSLLRDSIPPGLQPRLSAFSTASTVAVGDQGMLSEPEEESAPASSLEVLRLNAPEWPLLLVGTIAAVVQGATYPVFGILFAGILAVLPNLGEEGALNTSDVYSGMFLVVAGAAGLSMFLQDACFTSAGVKLTSRLRIQAFTSYLRNEIGFFDMERNSVGVLCARLSGDAAAVQRGTGARVGLILQSFAAVVIGTVIAFVYSWKMALVGIAFMPVVSGIVYFESHLASFSMEKENQAMETATKVATEAILAIRTVHSMGIEPIIMAKYRAALEEAARATRAALRWRGLVYGLGQFLPMASYNITFMYGGYLIADDAMPYQLAILVAQNMIVGSITLAQALVYAPNFREAATSASRILGVIRRVPLIFTETAVKEDPTWTATGAFNMKQVKFTYPTRPGQQILRGIDLKVEKGKTVALVGHSGCGKSTCLQLLQRFYDADSGTIELDSRNIRSALTLGALRRQLGVVQQEPTLFERSIADNIAFGDSSRDVPRHEVIEAARAANIHSFITGLPQGYDTLLGSGGAQMSGGQKQRVCIARALVRSPRLLLLDEATSALDAHSQKVVAELCQTKLYVYA